ncbi:MAG TPA: histidine phosphatase family protein [Acetobacteraceae bacterium]|nr:histidine phosphatase family protein [Acetobacteraceae bacterium]
MRAVVGSMITALALLAARGSTAQAQAPRPAAAAVSAAALTTPELVRELRSGGFVLVMRHAESPARLPTANEAEADNPQRERQLDAAGKASARELGQALHRLDIPIGRIYASPTYRAMQTVRLADLGQAQAVAQLAEGAGGMRASAGRARIDWLQAAVEQSPRAGTNTLIVTHTPNIVGAFGSGVANVQAGEMIAFRPQGAGRAEMVGRITVAQWRELAAH